MHPNPDPDRWSICKVGRPSSRPEPRYSDRCRRFIADDAPAFKKYMQPEGVSTMPSRYGKPRTLRGQEARYRAISEISFRRGRRSHRSEPGTITLPGDARAVRPHGLGHLRQIAELHPRLRLDPHSGPFQPESNPQPGCPMTEIRETRKVRRGVHSGRCFAADFALPRTSS
jgi:hypothetical protein